LRPVDRERFTSGLLLITIGYAKKVMGADWLGRLADRTFADPGSFTSLELLLGLYAYAFQIYLDFSAYTDIARGASRWFGIELPENFNAPYLATSITDFWRRWHMTLSRWLRDYLYIPLGGSRAGAARTYVNLMLTMLLGGLWHGASWTFVVWGGLHGCYLALERALGVGPEAHPGPAARFLRRVLTFHLVCLAWIFFRAPSFGRAWDYLRGIAAGTSWLTREQLPASLVTLLVLLGYFALAPLRRAILRFDPGSRPASQISFGLALGVVIVTLVTFGAASQRFIYFQF
jgi:D-alanyl-lipoteichoic acid acyltransferase DltB (MBOAT superfamily)